MHHLKFSESISKLGVQLEPSPKSPSLGPKPFTVETETQAQELTAMPRVDVMQDKGQSWLIPLAAGAVPYNELLLQPLSPDPQQETVAELATSNAAKSDAVNCDIPQNPPTQ